MKKVLVIAGSPGVGKSAVSKLLASRLNGVRVSLNDLVEKEGFNQGFDMKRETLVADTEKVSKRVDQIIKQFKGYIVVDGHFAVEVVSAGLVFAAFILRRNPDQLRKVLKKRGFKRSKIAENIAAEVLDVCLVDAVRAYGEKKVCEINVSQKTVEEVAAEIVMVVEGRRKCRIHVVDWLTKLELQGRLEEVLDGF